MLLDGMRGLVDMKPIVQALNRAVGILGSTQDEDQELPPAISIVMGAFPIKDTPETWLLDYSPICDGRKSRYTSGEVVARSRKGILQRMIGLYLRLADDIAKQLWLPRGGDICPRMKNIFHSSFFLCTMFSHNLMCSKGYCERQGCMRRHKAPSGDACKLRMKVCSYNMVSGMC